MNSSDVTQDVTQDVYTHDVSLIRVASVPTSGGRSLTLLIKSIKNVHTDIDPDPNDNDNDNDNNDDDNDNDNDNDVDGQMCDSDQMCDSETASTNSSDKDSTNATVTVEASSSTTSSSSSSSSPIPPSPPTPPAVLETTCTLVTISATTGDVESTASSSPSTADLSPNGRSRVSIEKNHDLTVVTDNSSTINHRMSAFIRDARFATDSILVVTTSSSSSSPSSPLSFACLKVPPPSSQTNLGWVDWSLKLVSIRSSGLLELYHCDGSKLSVRVTDKHVTTVSSYGRIEVWKVDEENDIVRQCQCVKYPKILKEEKVKPVGVGGDVFLGNGEVHGEFVFTSSPVWR